MSKTTLTIVSEFTFAKEERTIPVDGPVIPLIDETAAPVLIHPVLIHEDRWEAHAEDKEKGLYLIIWEGMTSPVDDHRKPDFVLKYVASRGMFCAVDRKLFSVHF